MNVHNDDNHKPIQLFDEIVSVQQPCRFATLGYNLPITNPSTPITTFVGFQNQPSHTNIHLVSINLKMERLHLFNRLEQLHLLDQIPSNQSIFIPHVEHVEPKATPIVIE